MRLKYLVILVFIFGCVKNEINISNEVLSNHLKMQNSINDSLLAKKGIRGFGGKVFCSHRLLGGNENELFITFVCQEYYEKNTDSLIEGSGIYSSGVIKYDDLLILDIETPRDGGIYSADIQQLFPNKIADKIFDPKFMSENYFKIKKELDSIQMTSKNY